MSALQDAGEFVPGGNFCKRVGAQNEEDLRCRPACCMEGSKRVRRIRRAAPEQLDAIATIAIPQVIERNRDVRSLRIWCAGCSTGPEPYTLSILLKTYFRDALAGWWVEIIGTDDGALATIGAQIIAHVGRHESPEDRFAKASEVAEFICGTDPRGPGHPNATNSMIRQVLRAIERIPGC